MKTIELLRTVIPLIVGHLILRRCPNVEDTAFPLANELRVTVWPFLLFGYGLAWHFARGGGRRIDAAFASFLAVMGWWMNTQVCRDEPERARLLLLILAAASILLVWLVGKVNVASSMMMLPLLIWFIFAEGLRLPSIHIVLPKIRLPSVSFSVNPGEIVSTGDVEIESK